MPALVKFHQQMGAFYRVEVELPRAVDKAREWELMVVDRAPIGPQGVPQDKSQRRKNVRVVYPRTLARCDEETRPVKKEVEEKQRQSQI